MSRRIPALSLLLCVLATLGSAAPGGTAAASLFQSDSYQSLTADRRASKPGDIVTILVYENSTASNTADTSTKASFSVQGSVSTMYAGNNAAQLGMGDSYGGRGQIQRTGRLLAQISARVIELQPNGDLVIAGEQAIDVNGEKTLIHLQGKVRPVDISELMKAEAGLTCSSILFEADAR